MDKNIKKGIRNLMGLNGLDFDVQKELEEWYNHLLNINARYVVFTEDSYILALICEIITEKQMEDTNNKEFIQKQHYYLELKKLLNTIKKILSCLTY